MNCGLNAEIAVETVSTICKAVDLLTPMKSPTVMKNEPVAKNLRVRSKRFIGDKGLFLKQMKKDS